MINNRRYAAAAPLTETVSISPSTTAGAVKVGAGLPMAAAVSSVS
jgi:hypothetical protein